jgi:peptidoglycan biosynthesis protein MviN/MurJ (putative lipid II flippase)
MTNLIPLRLYLQLEGLVALVAATVLYYSQHFNWWFYGLLFFAPDLFMLGYIVNRQIGALIYNLAHTYVAPGLLLGLGWLTGSTTQLAVGLIWCSHIGFDRLLGYGLKSASGFKDTHLQKV